MTPAEETVAVAIADAFEFRARADVLASPEEHGVALMHAAMDALKKAGYSVVPTGETEHVVDFDEFGWVIQHPLSCRPDLIGCPANSAFFDGPPDELGRYRFRMENGTAELLERVE